MNLFKFLTLSIFAILLPAFFILPSSAQAQTTIESINGLTLNMSTDNPLPGQTVTITALSYSFDIDTSTVVWLVNGVQKQRGMGIKKIDVTAPAAGKKVTVTATVTTANDTQFSKTITIGSGSVDMIVETDGYVPPFFKGKFPVVYQNNVKVIAIPHLSNSAGVEYDPATLTYNWRKDDGTALPNQSGYGKQSVTLKGAIVPRPFNLIVTVSSRDGLGQAQGIVEISPVGPDILFYKNDPIYGPLFNNAINGTLRIGSQRESGAYAALYGFNDVIDNIKNLKIGWSINSTDRPELSSSRSIVLRAPDGVSGTSKVTLNVSGVSNILQGITRSFNATFSKSNNAAEQITF